MKIKFQVLCFLITFLFGKLLFATELSAEKMSPSLSAPEAEWVFSGTVLNESGERYNYYFQMHRKGTQFTAVAALISSQNKNVLLLEESTATINHFTTSNWQVGHMFLQFNPINNSWVFGVKTKDRKGFNFKADTLKKVEYSTPIQGLRRGIELLINQTGHLNGHIQLGINQDEQFVTGQKAWFRQIWLSKSQEGFHPFTGVLCQFNNGSAFYAVHLQEADALRGAIAGWRNSQGLPVSMSQFVSVKEAKEGDWSIHISSPKIKLLLQHALVKKTETHQLIAGVTNDSCPGFCAINKEKLG